MMQQNLIVPNEDKPFTIIQVLRIRGFGGAGVTALAILVMES
ncbi:hypothetical protein [Rhizobium sp. 9140]|nr:hypothetical protein [Rhizobium sp. 9140]